MSDPQRNELTDVASGTELGAGHDTSSILEDDDQTVVPPALSTTGAGGRIGRRLVGLVATALGLAGCLLSLAATVIVLRVGLVAGESADALIGPISSSVDQMETRVDQTDDLVGRSGVDSADLDLLSARSDGLVDLADGAQRSLAAITGHPVYRWLPVELEPMEDLLGAIGRSATSLAEAAEGGVSSGRIPVADAGRISEEVNQLQAGFGDVRSSVALAADSLTRWIRLAALAGAGLALWSVWAQSWLLRRGWRAVLGHRP